MNSIKEFTNLGAVAVIFLFAVKEFFSYLKSRKNGESPPGTPLSNEVVMELKRMNDNHLHTLTDTVRDGNEKIVQTINDGNLKIVEALGEIKGQLKK